MYRNNSSKPARGIWFVIANRETEVKNLSNLGPAKTAAKSLPARSAVDVLNAMGDAKTRKLSGL